jgi:transcriptional regulator with XRE-family HTH domain
MNRVKKRAPGLNWWRWNSFGKELERWRGDTSLTQEQAGEAIGVSRRQWIRYTKGAPVPFDRLSKISKAFGVRLSRVLLHAGYEPKDPDVETEASLRHIRDAVFEGNLVDAFISLYIFYLDTHEEVMRYRPQPDVVMIKNFILAVEGINELPGWLRRELVQYLLSLEYGSNSLDLTVAPAIRKRVLARIKEEIRQLGPRAKRPYRSPYSKT